PVTRPRIHGATWAALGVLAIGCAQGERSPSRTKPIGDDSVPAHVSNRGADTMPPHTCADARAAIENRRFEGWSGLPPDCTPDALSGVAFDDATWGQLPLGVAHHPTRSRLLELTGYYRPLARVRDGVVVLFEGSNPALAGDVAGLLSSLGKADEVADFVF